MRWPKAFGQHWYDCGAKIKERGIGIVSGGKGDFLTVSFVEV
jgi:hypothetical protein